MTKNSRRINKVIVTINKQLKPEKIEIQAAFVKIFYRRIIER